jgi:hypothetical protein
MWRAFSDLGGLVYGGVAVIWTQPGLEIKSTKSFMRKSIGSFDMAVTELQPTSIPKRIE